ncbi:hypothetical protein CBL_20188 [Carabus blaptoides fortunei]
MTYHLVRFLEDGILYVCPASKVRKGVGNIRKVRYRLLGTFDAQIISTGGKTDQCASLQQYEDMAISLSGNLETQSEDCQISSQLESVETLQTISPANSPGSTAEYLLIQPGHNQISSELQCLHTLQSISPYSSPDNIMERTPSRQIICKTDMKICHYLCQKTWQLESLQTISPINSPEIDYFNAREDPTEEECKDIVVRCNSQRLTGHPKFYLTHEEYSCHGCCHHPGIKKQYLNAVKLVSPRLHIRRRGLRRIRNPETEVAKLMPPAVVWGDDDLGQL